MTNKNGLVNLVLSVTAAIGILGCAENPKYVFDEDIGNDHVRFYESRSGLDNYIEVMKYDGRKVLFIDRAGGFGLDLLEITKQGQTRRYFADSIDPVAQQIVTSAKQEFRIYSHAIIDRMLSPGYHLPFYDQIKEDLEFDSNSRNPFILGQ